jgi:hypothetical protein
MRRLAAVYLISIVVKSRVCPADSRVRLSPHEQYGDAQLRNFVFIRRVLMWKPSGEESAWHQ